MAETKNIARVWTFQSSSGKKTYETLQYEDASTSCNCPGWTRRVVADGSRSCKHIRMVDQGIAKMESISFHDYTIKEKKTKIKVGMKITKGGNRPDITNRLANI